MVPSETIISNINIFPMQLQLTHLTFHTKFYTFQYDDSFSKPSRFITKQQKGKKS